MTKDEARRAEEKADEMARPKWNELPALLYQSMYESTEADLKILLLEFLLCRNKGKPAEAVGDMVMSMVDDYIKKTSENYAQLPTEGDR